MPPLASTRFLPQFGSPRGHGAHPEREFCAPNVQAYAAWCGWVVRLASTHKYSLLRRTATETHHGTDPCSGTRTGGRGAPATYTRDGGATRPNLHATQTGPRRACHASFKRWQRFQPSTRTLIRTGPHTGRVERGHETYRRFLQRTRPHTLSRSALWRPGRSGAMPRRPCSR